MEYFSIIMENGFNSEALLKITMEISWEQLMNGALLGNVLNVATKTAPLATRVGVVDISRLDNL